MRRALRGPSFYQKVQDMPNFKITEGKLIRGEGPDKQVFVRGDHIELTLEQAKKHGMKCLTLAPEQSEMEMTVNPSEKRPGQKRPSRSAKARAKAAVVDQEPSDETTNEL